MDYSQLAQKELDKEIDANLPGTRWAIEIKLQRAQVYALLAIAEQLSHIKSGYDGS